MTKGIHSRPSRFGKMLRSIERPVVEARIALEGPVIRNAASLYGSTIITSFLGFLYWFVAARMVSAGAVGTASAVQAAAQLLAIFCVLGLSTLLISELAADRTHARTLMLTGATFVAIVAAATAGIVSVVAHTFSSTVGSGLSGTVGTIVFVLLSASTTMVMVLDDACIGLLRGDLQLRRNTVFAGSKLVLLPLLILAWATQSGTELVVAWLAGLIISLVTLAIALTKLTRGQSSRLDFRRLFAKRRLMAGHHWLNISNFCTSTCSTHPRSNNRQPRGERRIYGSGTGRRLCKHNSGSPGDCALCLEAWRRKRTCPRGQEDYEDLPDSLHRLRSILHFVLRSYPQRFRTQLHFSDHSPCHFGLKHVSGSD